MTLFRNMWRSLVCIPIIDISGLYFTFIHCLFCTLILMKKPATNVCVALYFISIQLWKYVIVTTRYP